MNDAWLKADLETAQMVLSRIEHEDIPKLKRLLERIATGRGVEVEEYDEQPAKVNCPSCGALIPNDGACWYCENHPGESVQTWHKDRGPEWPEEEE